MKQPFFNAIAACLGSIAFQSGSVSAAVPCDASWIGRSISAAPTTRGHLAAIRSSDGIFRASEWLDGSRTWSGWFNLPNQDASLTGEPWVQPIANPGTSFAAQNVFATSPTYIAQWILKNSNGNWTVSQKTIKSTVGSATVEGRATSAQFSPATATAAGNQFLIAKFSDGKIRAQKWIVSSQESGAWNGVWEDLNVPGGAPGVVSSPFAVQLTSSTFNLYVRVNGKLYQMYWEGTKWWTHGWIEVTGIPSPIQGDPTSAYSATTGIHFLHFFMGQYQAYHTVGKYNYGWTFNEPTWDLPSKSLAPVMAPNNRRFVYGIDPANNIMQLQYDNDAPDMLPDFWSTPNCVHAYDGP